MSTELTYKEARENLAAYALGALKPEEVDAIDRYLAEHLELRQELAQFDEAVASHASTGAE